MRASTVEERRGDCQGGVGLCAGSFEIAVPVTGVPMHSAQFEASFKACFYFVLINFETGRKLSIQPSL